MPGVAAALAVTLNYSCCAQLARQRREQEGCLPASPVGSPPSSPDTSQRLPDVPAPAPPPPFSPGWAPSSLLATTPHSMTIQAQRAESLVTCNVASA